MLSGFALGFVCWSGGTSANAAGVFGNTGLSGCFRWDAAPRTNAGNERSLGGGIRYSMQGGSYAGLFSQFTFSGGVTVTDSQLAVEEAFNAWTVTDPATGLTTALSFTPDFATTAVGLGDNMNGGLNTNGAEIDLFAYNDGFFWNLGNTGQQGETRFQAAGGPVTLTSGTTGYNAGAIIGSDIILNRGATYDLSVFRLLLSHEIGHSLGFADVDITSGLNGTFIDDNYDGTSNATAAAATLNNSWALLVNPLNPAASVGLSSYTVLNGQPGTKSNGVNILMESQGLGGQFGDLTPLSNHDYGGRQFPYPSLNVAVVPEAGTLALLADGAGLLGAVIARRRRA
ncbi:MAG: hypothetical protein H7Y38_15435 [Armatimonadetes bacterium]|nr:hypothetical protein [Armatimonadota bacterium]